VFGCFKVATMRTFQRLAAFLEQQRQRTRLDPINHAWILEAQQLPLLGSAHLAVSGKEISVGVFSAATAGSAAAGGAFTFASTVGVAGTGTAIGTLSGAAATNASLAWLGGGSLAAGGLGMAGGALVLGGLVVAPALAVTGFMIEAQGEKQLASASAYVAKIEGTIERMTQDIALMQGVCLRIDELQRISIRLHDYVLDSVGALEEIGTSFDPDRYDHIERISTALQSARALAEVLRVPVVPGQEDTFAGIVARYGFIGMNGG
jgi:hypothetical protein